MLLDDTGDGSARKEGGRHVKIVVSFQDEMKWKEVSCVSSPALKYNRLWNGAENSNPNLFWRLLFAKDFFNIFPVK